jgi:hypothetical protein
MTNLKLLLKEAEEKAIDLCFELIDGKESSGQNMLKFIRSLLKRAYAQGVKEERKNKYFIVTSKGEPVKVTFKKLLEEGK